MLPKLLVVFPDALYNYRTYFYNYVKIITIAHYFYRYWVSNNIFYITAACMKKHLASKIESR